MISRAHRFHGYNSLRNVYKHGQITRGPLFAIKSGLNERRKSYRLAVVVSRKVNKSAVARNRIRRRLYEIVRSMEADIAQPYDIVVTVFQNSLLDESAQQLTEQMKKQLNEAGILKKP
jgi:ribonuclease P protein component